MIIYSSTKVLPYVYQLVHKETGQFYIGLRFANIVPSSEDLGINYFTSSNHVKKLKFENFNFYIIAEFFKKEDAILFENELIKENWKNPLILNKAMAGKLLFRRDNSGQNNPMYGKSRVYTKEDRLKMSLSMKNSQKLLASRKSKEYRTKISEVQSNPTLLISAKSGEIISIWENCKKIADAFNYTYANIKNARRDKRIIGKRLSILSEPCYVVYEKDYKEFLELKFTS